MWASPGAAMGRLCRPPKQGERSAMRLRVLVAIVATVASGAVACSGGSDAPACPSFQAGDSVTMADFSFTPACIEAGAGATLSLDNQGEAPHTFTVDGTSVSVDVPAGQSASADLADVATGT